MSECLEFTSSAVVAEFFESDEKTPTYKAIQLARTTADNGKTIHRPAAGERKVILVAPGDQLHLAYSEQDVDASVFSEQGDDLLISFPGGGAILLQGFIAAALGDNPPSIVLADGTVLAGNVIVADLRDSTLEELAEVGAGQLTISGGGSQYEDGTGDIVGGLFAQGTLLGEDQATRTPKAPTNLGDDVPVILPATNTDGDGSATFNTNTGQNILVQDEEAPAIINHNWSSSTGAFTITASDDSGIARPYATDANGNIIEGVIDGATGAITFDFSALGNGGTTDSISYTLTFVDNAGNTYSEESYIIVSSEPARRNGKFYADDDTGDSVSSIILLKNSDMNDGYADFFTGTTDYSIVTPDEGDIILLPDDNTSHSIWLYPTLGSHIVGTNNDWDSNGWHEEEFVSFGFFEYYLSHYSAKITMANEDETGTAEFFDDDGNSIGFVTFVNIQSLCLPGGDVIVEGSDENNMWSLGLINLDHERTVIIDGNGGDDWFTSTWIGGGGGIYVFDGGDGSDWLEVRTNTPF